MKKLTIALGKTYVDEIGDLVVIVAKDKHETHPYIGRLISKTGQSGMTLSYSKDGKIAKSFVSGYSANLTEEQK